MKFNLYSSSKLSHSGYVSCAIWINNELVLTCGDDRKLLFWHILTHTEPIKTLTLPTDAIPTTMHYYPHHGSFTSDSSMLNLIKIDSSSNNSLAIGTTNGCFYLLPINWNGTKLDRTFEAHKGAIIVIRWSNDNGSTLATTGEDGLVKIWSKVGMLRSTIQVSNTSPVYALSWSPDSNSLAYVNQANLVIKSLSPQSKALEWMAHEGVIISIDWSPLNNRILTASEDGRIKIWDTTGRMIYVSGKHSSALTSVAWSSDGELFTASTFNSLELHDQFGHCLSMEKLSMEGLVSISWSPDIQQVCCVCSSGRVLFASVVDRILESKFWQATNISRRSLKVNNSTNEFQEILEFKDPMLKFSLQFDHLIVVTKSQCFIYKINNFATPYHFEMKSDDLNRLMIKQSHKYFALINLSAANLYSYDGRFLKTIKLFNMRPESLLPNHVSMNDHIIAYRDSINIQMIHLIDLENQTKIVQKSSGIIGQSTDQYQHQLAIINIKLNTEQYRYKSSSSNEDVHHLCAILDRNSDLYILSWTQNNVNSVLNSIKSFKLSPMIRDICWHVDYNLLVSLHENQKNLSIWLHPNAVFMDSSLLQDAILTLSSQEISSNSRIVEFSQNRITIERQDRLKIYMTVNPFVILLHKHKIDNRLDEAVRMCNFLDKSIHEIEPVERNVRDSLWATLAVMSLEQKQFRIAEVAYAAINKLDKVLYLNRIKTLKSQELITIESELLCGNFDLAENLLIQKGYFLRAIYLHLQLQNWIRAIDLAQKFNSKFPSFSIKISKKVNSEQQENEQEPINLEDPNEIKVDLIHMVISCWEKHCRKQQNSKYKQQTKSEQLQKLANEIDYIVDWSLIEEKLQQDSFLYSQN
ncbi:intraflagellar transport protein Oseg5 [Dermatophagoides pteronyssinus]|uniref:intraflagellar transport protein Oseg5 n=1 Tax=Dermatophagoides pteronyssinus TaxID=6956 RepID=UPI003F68036F